MQFPPQGEAEGNVGRTLQLVRLLPVHGKAPGDGLLPGQGGAVLLSGVQHQVQFTDLPREFLRIKFPFPSLGGFRQNPKPLPSPQLARCDTCGHEGKLSQSLPIPGDVKHFCDFKCLLHFCHRKLSPVDPSMFHGTRMFSEGHISILVPFKGPLTAKQTFLC